MTKEQAIAILRYNSNVIHQTINGEIDPNEVEALDMAIKALEQNEKLKADNKILAENCLKDLINCHSSIIEEQLLQVTKLNTSKDCVSREQAKIDVIPNSLYTSEQVIALLDNLSPVTPAQSWIPVSERLPEDRNIVLVTAYWHETYQVMMASYFGEGLWWCVPFNNCGDHMQKLNPKAWSPLPKPYEEK